MSNNNIPKTFVFLSTSLLLTYMIPLHEHQHVFSFETSDNSARKIKRMHVYPYLSMLFFVM